MTKRTKTLIAVCLMMMILIFLGGIVLGNSFHSTSSPVYRGTVKAVDAKGTEACIKYSTGSGTQQACNQLFTTGHSSLKAGMTVKFWIVTLYNGGITSKAFVILPR